MDNWYDTVEGISERATTLKGFLEIKSARRMHYSSLKHTFIVLGRYMFNLYGEFGEPSGFIPAEKWKNIPAVMTFDEFEAFAEKRGKDATNEIRFQSTDPLPSEKTRCPLCNKGWNISSLHNRAAVINLEQISSSSFMGMTLGRIEKLLNRHEFKEYSLDSGITIVKLDVPDQKGYLGRHDHLYLDRNLSKERRIYHDYVVREHDLIRFFVTVFYHQSCILKRIKKGFVERRADGYPELDSYLDTLTVGV